jgi:hypothetical protein
MKKRYIKSNKIIKDLKRNEILFTKVNKNGYITEDTNKNVLIEQEIKTYKIKNLRKKMILYELNRKQKPKRLKTFQKTKTLGVPSVLVSRLQDNKIKIKEKKTYEFTNKDKSITYVNTQANYKPRFPKSRSMYGSQIIAVAVCFDSRRNISASLLAHSKPQRVWNDSKIKKAMKQIYSSAYTKFIGLYGRPSKSGDLLIAVDKDSVRFKTWYQKD